MGKCSYSGLNLREHDTESRSVIRFDQPRTASLVTFSLGVSLGERE